MSLLFMMMSLLPAFADDTPDAAAPTFRYQDVTRVDFEEHGVVTAGLVRPSVIWLAERPRLKFNPLTPLRRDFEDAIAASVSDVH